MSTNAWNELDAAIVVDCSFVERSDTDGYRFWDADCTIPAPEDGVIHAQILINGQWQEMRFNRVWGKRYDPNDRGAWLRQKVSKSFSAQPGRHRYKVRYKLRSEVKA
jgi:hypothetical protein